MKTTILAFSSSIAALAAIAATVHPADDGRVLCNPGMGWTMHYLSLIHI